MSRNTRLTLGHIVRRDYSVQSKDDHRRRVDYCLCAYYDAEGNEYRKAFEHPRGTPFEPPLCGPNGILTDWKYKPTPPATQEG